MRPIQYLPHVLFLRKEMHYCNKEDKIVSILSILLNYSSVHKVGCLTHWNYPRYNFAFCSKYSKYKNIARATELYEFIKFKPHEKTHTEQRKPKNDIGVYLAAKCVVLLFTE